MCLEKNLVIRIQLSRTFKFQLSNLDRLVHYPDSDHIAVYHKGRWYKVSMFFRNNLLQPCELQLYVVLFFFEKRAEVSICLLLNRQLDEIVRDTTTPDFGEEHLAALTAGERTSWANTRETYFSTGINRISLDAIERAAFVLILDDEEYEVGIVSRKFHISKETGQNSLFSLILVHLYTQHMIRLFCVFCLSLSHCYCCCERTIKLYRNLFLAYD